MQKPGDKLKRKRKKKKKEKKKKRRTRRGRRRKKERKKERRKWTHRQYFIPERALGLSQRTMNSDNYY